jgi:hypothetical protein
MSDEIKNENEFNEFEDPLELEFGEDENKDETITKTCIVYKIFCKIEESVPIYIGSTTQKLKQRWKGHKKSFNDIKKGKSSKTISIHPYFEKYNGIDNFQIESLEQVKITGVRKDILKQIRILEQKWLDKFRNESIEICNKMKAYLSEEQKKQQQKEYQNSEKIQAWRKTHTDCPCGGAFDNTHKSRHEQTPQHQRWLNPTAPIIPNTISCECGGKYTTDHRNEHLNSIRHKEWVETGELKQSINESYKCDCGGDYTLAHIYSHEKTKQHQKWLEIKDVNKIVCKCLGTYTLEGHLQHLQSKRHTDWEKIDEPKTCPCGGSYSRKHAARHQKTKKHQEYLQTLQTLNPEPATAPISVS